MEKTIAAISTGMTPAGIQIIRISGPEAIQIADRLFQGRKPLEKEKTHTIHHGYMVENGLILDEVLASVMKAPHTYTGENTVEINCHGGILVTRTVLDALVRAGAQIAEPGEFTKRAFLNGRMDLSRAEAVMDVISAQNQFALKASVSRLRGSVSKKVADLRDRILNQTSYIEAALDDPEHYDLTGFGESLGLEVTKILSEVQGLLKKADDGRLLQEGIRTVIAGRPNAGKSSLFNLLSGEEKAIVTDIAGTTRDILEIPVNLQNISLLLMDTAGLRKTEDRVEKIGVERARKALQEADLVLYVVDALEGMQEEDRDALKALAAEKDQKVLVIFNKSDLLKEEEMTRLEEENSPYTRLLLSSRTGAGLQKLEDMILSLFEAQKVNLNDEVYLTNAREKACMAEAEQALLRVLEGISQEMSEEFLTIDLMDAYTALGKIIGESLGDDVVDRVFEKFCMGK